MRTLVITVEELVMYFVLILVINIQNGVGSR